MWGYYMQDYYKLRIFTFFSSILQSACPLVALLSHQWITACSSQQQWLVLCNCFAFPHALVCDLFNCLMQMENEQDPGLHDVPPLLYIPDNQRDVRRSNHFLSRICLSQSHCCSQWTWIRKTMPEATVLLVTLMKE